MSADILLAIAVVLLVSVLWTDLKSRNRLAGHPRTYLTVAGVFAALSAAIKIYWK
jgi:hypothetical protein